MQHQKFPTSQIIQKTPILALFVALAGFMSACDPSALEAQLASGTPSSASSAPVASIAFSPSGGAVGSLLTVTSTNGSDLSGTTSVTIGGVSSTPLSVTTSKVVAMVMPGSGTGGVSLTNANGTSVGASNFSLTTPSVIANQQGTKIIPSDNTGAAHFGLSSALSADGNTFISGGYTDNANQGAAWVFVRSAGVWTQQGPKLTPANGGVNTPYFGTGVSLSADGNTACVGAWYDNGAIGAVWFFTRSGGVWTQQGNKITATGIIGTYAELGFSAALSADGNTAAVGGFYDNTAVGAVWIFNRVAGVWSQTAKLVGTGSVGQSRQGAGVAINSDGTTVASASYGDNSSMGAVWIFTLSAGTWAQQGTKLTPSDTSGAGVRFGQTASLSMDGNTLVAGAPYDNANIGATWVFTRAAGVWTQQGNKLVANDNVGAANQGRFTGVSGDGNTLITGGWKDNNTTGAVWTYTRTAGVWSQQGTKLVGSGGLGATVGQGISVAMSMDGSTAVSCGNGDNGNVGAAWVFTP